MTPSPVGCAIALSLFANFEASVFLNLPKPLYVRIGLAYSKVSYRYRPYAVTFAVNTGYRPICGTGWFEINV